jgi:hypothetical protein
MKNGGNGVIQALLWFCFALDPEKQLPFSPATLEHLWDMSCEIPESKANERLSPPLLDYGIGRSDLLMGF